MPLGKRLGQREENEFENKLSNRSGRRGKCVKLEERVKISFQIYPDGAVNCVRKEEKMRIISAGRCMAVLLICTLSLAAVPVKAGAAGQDVYLTYAKGEVSLQNAVGRTLESFDGMELQNGSRLRTGSDGCFRIQAGEGTFLLESCGLAELRTAKRTPEFLLERGVLAFEREGKDFSLYIRTSVAAVKGEAARGWVCVLDRRHTLVCLEEGELHCSVADPAGGQAKTVSIKGGQTAECVVYPDGGKDGHCEILVRELTEEDRKNRPVCGGAKGQESAKLRDPVWTGAPLLADAAGEKDTKNVGALEDKEESGGAPGNVPDSSVGTYTPPYMPDFGISSDWGKALAQTVPEADSSLWTDAPSSEPAAPAEPSDPTQSSAPAKPSGTSGTSGPSKPAASEDNTPEESATPEQPGTPADPGAGTPAPTEDMGLVVSAGANNYGTIVVKNGGKIEAENGEITNYQNLIVENQGVIDGTVVNNDTYASFWMLKTEGKATDGKVARVINQAGFIGIEGGTVEEGVDITGGSFRMSGGIVKAPQIQRGGGSALHMEGGADSPEVEITGGTVINEYGGSAVYVGGKGKLTINERASIKAAEPLKTLDVGTVDSAAITYTYYDYVGQECMAEWTVSNGAGFAALYVTAKDTDGLAELRGLTDRFSEAVGKVDDPASPGDTITLSRDVDYDTTETMFAKGGTENTPIVLDLHGHQLAVKRQAVPEKYNAGLICFDSKAVWRIENGALEIVCAQTKWAGLHIKDSSNLTLSGVVILQDCDFYNYDGSKLMIIDPINNSGNKIRGIYNCYNSDCIISGVEVSGQNRVYNYYGSRLTISDGAEGMAYISNGDGYFIPSVVTDEMKLYQEKPSQLNISGAKVGDIYNCAAISSNDAAADDYANNTIVQVTASETGDISNDGGTVTVKDSGVRNLSNSYGTLTVSDSTIWLDEYASGGVQRISGPDGGINCVGTSRCQISGSTIRLLDGSSRIYNYGDSSFSMSESGIEGGEIKCEVAGGSLNIEYSEKPVTPASGSIYISNGGVCTLTNCKMAVTEGINVEYGTLEINGGAYTYKDGSDNPVSSPVNAIIAVNAYGNNGSPNIVKIGGGTELNGGNIAVPIYITTGGTFFGNFNITLNESAINGGKLPALCSGFKSSYSMSGDAVRKLTINDGAHLSSECSKGTILFDGFETMQNPQNQSWNLELELNGGSIVNENEDTDLGCALGFYRLASEEELKRQVSFKEDIFTVLRARRSAPIIWFDENQTSNAYPPEGYQFKKDGDYGYLEKIPEGTTAESVISDSSDAPAEAAAAPVLPEDALQPEESVTESQPKGETEAETGNGLPSSVSAPDAPSGR